MLKLSAEINLSDKNIRNRRAFAVALLIFLSIVY